MQPIEVAHLVNGRTVPFSALKQELGSLVFQCLKLPSETALRAFSPKSYSRALIIENNILYVCKCDENGNVSYKYQKSAGEVKQTYFVDKKVLHQYDVHYEAAPGEASGSPLAQNDGAKKSMFGSLFGSMGKGSKSTEGRENDVFVFQPNEGGRFYEALRDARSAVIYGNAGDESGARRGSETHADAAAPGTPASTRSTGEGQRRRFSDLYKDDIKQAEANPSPIQEEDGFGELARRGSAATADDDFMPRSAPAAAANPFAQAAPAAAPAAPAANNPFAGAPPAPPAAGQVGLAAPTQMMAAPQPAMQQQAPPPMMQQAPPQAPPQMMAAAAPQQAPPMMQQAPPMMAGQPQPSAAPSLI